jgi:anti-anti-sigma factor
MSKRMLTASVAAGDGGPVIVLSGEADLTCTEQLNTVITGQLSKQVRQLTIDASGLSYADSASIRTLVLAARTLRDRDGILILLHPQASVARMLALTGADQLIKVRAVSAGTP